MSTFRFSELSEDIREEVQEFLDKYVTTPVKLQYAFQADTRLKKLIKAEKVSDKYLVGMNGAQVLITVNESVWDLVSADIEALEILVREEFQGISINEKDVVKVQKPAFNSFKPIIEKYSFDQVDRAKELQKTVYEQVKDAEKDQKIED